MAASVNDLINWFTTGVEMKYTHMIVVCDTYDYDDYPVYVKKGENAREEVRKRDGVQMQKVMEVYDLREEMGPQMKSGTRVWNYGVED